MRITRVGAVGLKGGCWVHDLEPVTIITGRNFVGKTARLDAIRLGLIGYLPELGKTNGATCQLATGTELRIGLKTEQTTGERIWQLNKGAWKASTTGELPDVPPVLMDPEVYFGMSEKDRVHYVFGLAHRDGDLDIDDLLSKVRSQRLEGTDPEQERAALDRAAELIDLSDRSRHDNGVPVADWMETLLGELNTARKAAKLQQERMEKTVQGIVVLAGDQAPKDQTRLIEATERDLRKAQADLGEARANRKSLADLELGILKARQALNETTDYGSKIEEVRQKLTAIGELTPVDMGPLNQSEKAVAEARAVLSDAEANARLTETRQDEERSKLAACTALEACPKRPWGHGSWIGCGSVGTGWNCGARASGPGCVNRT